MALLMQRSENILNQPIHQRWRHPAPVILPKPGRHFQKKAAIGSRVALLRSDHHGVPGIIRRSGDRGFDGAL